ncbi:MAG: transcriptional regulator NrdR [Oscillospiraceae bacterium]|nr:transcriptional regulator NrdR [Oscillospiraceae bacterium]
MKCPYCAFGESKVIDSRPAEEGVTIRRRRECLSCQKRFTTYETMERLPLMVAKKDGTRQVFDKEKLVTGLTRACEKRPVSTEAIEAVARDIEQELQNRMEREVTAMQVGELVMDRLRDLDDVAYVRFASVYRQFKDIGTFLDEVNKLLIEK